MDGNDVGIEEEEAQRSRAFSRLKPLCLELFELLHNPNKHSSALPELLQFLQSSPPDDLQPFFDYILFPLLLLLDSAVDCRSAKEVDSGEKHIVYNVPQKPFKVNDGVAECMLHCLEELLNKCYIASVEQMVVVLKKLTYAALLSPSEAAEEFRGGVIKCLRALVLSLRQCSNESCSCKQSFGLPALLEKRDLQLLQDQRSKYRLEPEECLLAFLQSPNSSAAIGHWLSLLLKTADTEVSRGHRGSGKLRVEAFITLRVLVSKVGIADALAFFLPGVVSQFAKVLHVSKTMISGAAGSVEALNQAIRGLAEYLMIVLQDDGNLSGVEIPASVTSGSGSNKIESVHSFLEELRQLPMKAQAQAQSKTVAEELKGETVILDTPSSEIKEKGSTKSGNAIGSLHVDRTKEWIEKTSAHVDKLLCATFMQICVHPSRKVRQGLLAAIQGLLLRCSHTLKSSRLMLLECLFVLVVDESEEVSSSAQHFLEVLSSSSGKHSVESDVAEIFGRLMEKLPKMVLGSEESLALSNAQRLLAILYFSGPQFVVNHLRSPVTAARFLDVVGLCLSQNSLFSGALDKLVSARASSTGYLQSVAELKAGSLFNINCQNVMNVAAPSDILKITDTSEKEKRYPMGDVQSKYKVPQVPPWFIHVGSQKLYQAVAGILRLVGLSFMADFRSEGLISVIIDIPLGHLRKLVSELRLNDYNKESWQSWYDRTATGHLLRQASTAACIINEMIYGMSDRALDSFGKMFIRSRLKEEEVQESYAGLVTSQPCKSENELGGSMWKVSQEPGAQNNLVDCIGRILHEYLSAEVWDLPVDHDSSRVQPSGGVENITLHLFHDTAMLHQVLIDGIGIFALCLGKDFALSGFLHSSLYLLLENLIHSNFQVRSASDAVLQVLSAASGYPTVGHLVLENADYVIDSICRQLRHLDLNAHVPNVLAAMLSYIGVAQKILPLLEEPMRCISQELEILGRHQHPELTIPFLKAVAEIVKASKREACSLPSKAESFFMHVKSSIAGVHEQAGTDSMQASTSYSDNTNNVSHMQPEKWETIMFELNDFRRYRRTVASIAGSCLTAATPLLASMQQASCLVALDIVEDSIVTLAKLEETYRHEKETKEAVEEVFQSYSFHQLKDAMDAAEDGNDGNILLPAMNKTWPYLVACVRNNQPVAVRRCLGVTSSVVQICGGDFFSRRFHTDGAHFWKLLSTSPFQKKSHTKEERNQLQLPYRGSSTSTEDSVAEVTSQKVQIAMLNIIADLARNRRSASALEVVLKKVSGLVVGIACSSVTGLRDASINALHGLASIDPDLIWLLLADVYYSLKKKDIPSPPMLDFPEISQILPPPLSSKGFLYVQYGGQSYGFDVDFLAVESVFKKLHLQVFTNQTYI
ncbi:uncharacterized protein LOC119989047 [Tripterygium wilfordii]|uniref:uncharacterized protein LOC119989047 n=1 Tax=Tripterygium wilfordii TaxID=458696 RepID=UPI0018F84DAB|nr:uncharacterized protein LOC119989047 [Tripterygium wilfordii]